MGKEAQQVGEIFRAKREQKSLSLKEVESATSIRTTYLQAIEEGFISEIISKVYMYGFMRQYALYLSLDIEKIVEEYPNFFKLPKETHEFAYGIGTLESRSSIYKRQRVLPKLVLGGSLVLAFLIVWWIIKVLRGVS